MFLTPTQPDVISVSTLNRMARDLLEAGLPAVWIGGEISNLTLAASGHAYFSLKDSSAQIRCVMFRQRLAAVGLRLAEGMQVELKGTVTLYEARGDYQINVASLRAAGLGRLFEAFERLKARLAAEGLFDEAKKRPIPAHPRAIGIVTSPAAAALRDVVSTLKRRAPAIPVILYPTPVQGEGAADKIACAIRIAGQRAEVDVLIVCRGGGSIEDLWAFNEEVVARAVADSPIPVVSGVGHETDFTICDFVADLRAPTPTGAAERVSPSREQMMSQVDLARRRLERALSRLMTDKTQQLDYLSRRLVHPGQKLALQAERLAATRRRLALLAEARLAGARRSLSVAEARLVRQRPRPSDTGRVLDALGHSLRRAMLERLNRRRLALAQYEATLVALNPEAVLSRGYAIVEKADGSAAKSPGELRQGERVTLRLAEGQTQALIDHPDGAQQTLPF
ncbi:exodeoxyribonuclease VII large subunit [Crenobacter cavernae]|uniref:Exodeoxyribonuclease 7 large subunit n=1 Tax=Crenobacter cavernae TaxID=2290923 RepID=A0A345Y2V3_9NEIS|nr:exodeoxyribonuclease VII large subunit [Crenobacter cavernae]AXK38255.1 exodeoxyribonuclease VII large subunit [Crenobacter cavernae]